MDIRFVKGNIFELQSDAILYFIENSLLEENSKKLVEKAGERILEPLTKISGIEKGECKIIPGFNITSDYVILANLPDDLKKNNKSIFKNLIYNVFCEMKKFEIHSLNIDYSFLTEKYSSEFVNLINEVIDEKSLRISDFLVFMCKI
ncbi:MAG: hypothetical protein E6162_02400 [Finegoldia magna]|uniref:hypothetical protein n=1 Tax=Finegoldia TaxID=150022 RepID=UPI0025F0D33D|nr:hypothetical protein [Finegoldia magna]MDU1831802.1 hypothetical protein [Finegoldia magna]MDU1878415.1 hypothetical protein [Finegoldia magna]MDU4571782.1 hypothetical protein [Finegoldia magna]MDU5272033.1 hypothetical protein [Finegoldia magna]